MSTENKNKTRRVRVGFFTGNGSKKDGTSAAKLAFEQMTTADTVTFPITYTTDTPNRGLKLVILQKDHLFLFIKNIKQLGSEMMCIFEFILNDIISKI